MPSFDLTSKFWQIVMLKYACHHIFIYLYEFFIGLYGASDLLTQRINLALSNPNFHIIHLNSKLVNNKNTCSICFTLGAIIRKKKKCLYVMSTFLHFHCLNKK